MAKTGKKKQALYRYTKQGLNLRIFSQGISKTNIREFLRTMPINHMRRLNAILFIDKLPEGNIGHHWEEKNPNRMYYAIYYRNDNGEMNIVVYITREFLFEIKKNRVWIDVIRRAILHEIGHHLLDITGNNYIFVGSELEDFVDRYTERRSNMKVLHMKSYQQIQKYDRHWIEIERMIK